MVDSIVKADSYMNGRPVTLKSSERFHKIFLKVADGIYQIVWQTKRYLPPYLLITLTESQQWKDNYHRYSTNSLNVLVGFPSILTFLMVSFLFNNKFKHFITYHSIISSHEGLFTHLWESIKCD